MGEDKKIKVTWGIGDGVRFGFGFGLGIWHNRP
jgi:hypothetical protein